MTKTRKIIYWIATIWLALGMTSTGIVQLIHYSKEVQKIQVLGYPSYFLSIIGVWKLLGALVVVLPRLPLLKEWVYAGFFFTMSGAVFSHLAIGDPAIELFGPLLLLVLTMLSWYFRPPQRRLSNPQPSAPSA